MLPADGQDGWLFFPGFIFKTYLSPPPLATVVCEKQRNDMRLYMFGSSDSFLVFISPCFGLLILGGAETFAVQLRQSTERHRWQFDQLRPCSQLAGSGQPRSATLPSAAVG